MVTIKVWNKEGVSRLGHLFEYEDDEANQKCQKNFKRLKEMRKKIN